MALRVLALIALIVCMKPFLGADVLETLSFRVEGESGNKPRATMELEIRSDPSGEALRPLSRAHRRFLIAAELAGSGWTILGPRGRAAAPSALSRSLTSLWASSLTPFTVSSGASGATFRSATASGLQPRGWSPSVSGVDPSLLAELRRDAACPLPPLPPESSPGQTPLCALVEDGSGRLEAWTLSVSREAFPGERAFLSSAAMADQRYGKRAIALLGSFFDRRGRHWDRFVSCMADLGWKLSAAEWAAFDGKEGLANAQAGLAAALSRALGPSEARCPAPVLSLSPDERLLDAALFRPGPAGFDALWASGRSPYVEALLAWQFDLAKPLLSRETHATLQAAGIPSKTWEGHRTIDAAEGLQLARAALRFYCWGVEYSSPALGPEDAAGHASLWAQSGVAPLATGDLRAWATNLPLAGSKRTDGYFPFSALPSAPSLPVRDGGARWPRIEIPADAPVLRGFRQIAPAGGMGRPLPWSDGGTDGPRSFAVKMSLQLGARRALSAAATASGTPSSLKKAFEPFIPPADSTAAAFPVPFAPAPAFARESWTAYPSWFSPGGGLASWRQALICAADGSGLVHARLAEHIRPFIPGPGRADPATATADCAGVDAGGLLSAALAMTDFADRVEAFDGTSRPALRRDEYERSIPTSLLPAYRPEASARETARRLGLSFSPADLERNSVLLPDLSLLREGDLIVSGGLADEPFRLGIVVHAPAARRPTRREDPRPWLASVIVLSACPERGRVSLGAWDCSGVEGASGPEALSRTGFTPDPLSCQARRLIVVAESRSEAYPTEAWDFLSTRPDALWVDLSFAERWIPNTGQFLPIEAIRLEGATNGRPCGALPGRSESSVIPSGGVDRHHGAAHWASSNSAGSAFALWAFDGDCERVPGLPLAALVSDGSGRYAALATHSSGFSSAVFDPGMAVKKGWKSYADASGRYTIEGGGRTFRRFGLRPLRPGSSRPGDDILLSFRYASGSLTLEGTAPPGQYLAQYDKKLLWRAQLYADQGAGDWNDAHPWNAPSSEAGAANAPWWWEASWGYNEWNMYRNESEPQGAWSSTGSDLSTAAGARALDAACRAATSSARSAPLPGGQVIRINEWRSWNRVGHPFPSVSYSWAGEDSPFEFDQELLEQRAAIRSRRREELSSQAGPSYLALPWDGTTAPSGEWDNYLFPRRRIATLSDPAGKTYAYDGKEGGDASQHPWTMPPGALLSTPGLTTFLAFSADMPPARKPGNELLSPHISGTKGNFYTTWQVPYSSGIDCSGFVWRSLSYAGHPYAVNWRIGVGTDSEFDGAEYTKMITPAGPNDGDNTTGLDEIVPGDVLLWQGTHIAIVTDVQADPMGKVEDKARLYLVHAGSGNKREYAIFPRSAWFIEESDLVSPMKYAVKRLVIR